MGKKNFRSLYRDIKSELGDITCKITCFTHEFDSSKDYAGVVVYAVNGSYQWQNNCGDAKCYRGKSFYVIILSTENYPDHMRRLANQGTVHHYPLIKIMGLDAEDNNVCCGGFAYHNGTLKFNSMWLNSKSQQGTYGESDGRKELSADEIELVKYIFEQYKQLGPHSVFKIPSDLDIRLS